MRIKILLFSCSLLPILSIVTGCSTNFVTPDSIGKGDTIIGQPFSGAVLIAAAFCMYNRYVDGLATWQPRNEELYRTMGRRLADHGYAQPSVSAVAEPK